MKFKKRLKGNITAYVMILFGMTVILYMFGFTNTMDTYLQDAEVNESGIEDASFNQEANPLVWMMEVMGAFITENPLVAIGGLAGIILTGLIGRLAHVDMSVFYTYIIPIGLLAVFLNLVIFPITPDAQLVAWDFNGLTVSMILIVFFNLFFLLAVIDYVRGGGGST